MALPSLLLFEEPAKRPDVIPHGGGLDSGTIERRPIHLELN